jgi:PAS domain S-box-containing protein
LKQKEAQEALQASEERFRLLMESIEDYAIIMLDRQGRVATWNSGAEHIKGYSEEEILGQHFSHFYPKEDVEQGKIDLQLQEASEKGRFENENWLVRKDGSKFWANIILTALKDDAGNIRGFAKVTRDITQRKKIEEEQACLQEELLQAQQQTIYELSTPLIPLTEQVLVMPLVGVIDSSRAQQILETLLEGVANQQAEIAILDITGVQVVDTQVANAILQAAQAVKLLGAQVILTGISPVLAQTLVQLGADMRDIITCATLQVGIGYASRGRQSGRHKG